MNDSGKTLTGILLGLIAGAAIGLLLAPSTGSDLRDKLNESLKNVADDVKKKVSEQLDNLNEKKGKIRQDAEELHEDFVA